jgi:hypothetical protein
MPARSELDESLARVLSAPLLRECLTEHERQIVDTWLKQHKDASRKGTESKA